MFEMEFLELAPHIVEFRTQQYVGGDWVPTGDVRQYRVRVSGKGISLRKDRSEDDTVIYDVHVLARIEDDGSLRPVGGDRFTVHDLVSLPDEYAFLETNPIIFAIDRNTDEHGHHHVKVQLGWMYHRQTSA